MPTVTLWLIPGLFYRSISSPNLPSFPPHLGAAVMHRKKKNYKILVTEQNKTGLVEMLVLWFQQPGGLFLQLCTSKRRLSSPSRVWLLPHYFLWKPRQSQSTKSPILSVTNPEHAAPPMECVWPAMEQLGTRKCLSAYHLHFWRVGRDLPPSYLQPCLSSNGQPTDIHDLGSSRPAY